MTRSFCSQNKRGFNTHLTTKREKGELLTQSVVLTNILQTRRVATRQREGIEKIRARRRYNLGRK